MMSDEIHANVIHTGDALEILRSLPGESVHCCVTSPPYWGLRDYGVAGQIGLEATPEEFIEQICSVFREVRRVLRSDGTCWINIGDTYAGSWKGSADSSGQKHRSLYDGKQCTNRGSASSAIPIKNPATIGYKPKDLMGMPWRVAFALQADGWYLRSEIIWSKPNPMPESVKDRPTKAHEQIFLLAKSERYFYDHEAIKEDGHPSVTGNKKIPAGWDNKDGAHGRFNRSYTFARNTASDVPPGTNKQFRDDRQPVEYRGTRNKRTVWTVATAPFKAAHFATFPPNLIKPCIMAGCPEGGIVLDPFMGAGTTAVVATQLGRRYVGIELNPEYVKLSVDRIQREGNLTKTLDLEV